MADIFTAAFWNQYGALLWKEFLHTMVMTGVSTFFAYLIGLPLGVLLVLTADHGIRPHRILNQVVGWIINVGRSLPFIILMISIMDFTKLVVGTKIGVKGAIGVGAPSAWVHLKLKAKQNRKPYSALSHRHCHSSLLFQLLSPWKHLHVTQYYIYVKLYQSSLF